MQADLDEAMDLILVTEGGFVNHPKDPGGPTNMGTTLATLSAWRKTQCTVEDLKDLGKAEVKEIFAAQYALPIRFGDLPKGVDYCLLDCAVNSGPGRAIRILQQTLGMMGHQVDGVIGAKTLAALSTIDPSDLVEEYCEARLGFMKTLKVWSTFGKGWTARNAQVLQQAIALIDGGVPSTYAAVMQSVGKATGATKLLSSVNGKAAVSAAAGVVVTSGGVATELASVLAPYSQVKYVGYALLGCSAIAAVVPLAAALRKAASGEASA